VPDGVFNVVQGDARTGRAMTAHPGIAKVSLTGEVGTGKAVMAAAAATLKHVTLELGGKSPMIVFEDADLDDAVSGALLANFYTQGEICSNGTRVFVHESIHADFVGRLTARTEKMRIGDPLDPETDVGSLISAEHMEKVLGYIELAKESGARLLCGGRRPPGLEAGFFVEPTVFDRCTDDMRFVREEIFGPVMAVLTFGSEGRGGLPCQRHRLRARGRGVHEGPHTRASGGSCPRGGHRVDQHLQPHADRDAVRRLQTERHRTGELVGGDRALHPAQVGLRGVWVTWRRRTDGDIRLRHRRRRFGGLGDGEPAVSGSEQSRARPRGGPARLLVGRLHPHACRAGVPDRQPVLRLEIRIGARTVHGRPPHLSRSRQGAGRIVLHQRDDLPAGQPHGLRAVGSRSRDGDLGLRPLPSLLQADGDLSGRGRRVPGPRRSARPRTRSCRESALHRLLRGSATGWPPPHRRCQRPQTGRDSPVSTGMCTAVGGSVRPGPICIR
jgi:hypothetical protein